MSHQSPHRVARRLATPVSGRHGGGPDGALDRASLRPRPQRALAPQRTNHDRDAGGRQSRQQFAASHATAARSSGLGHRRLPTRSRGTGSATGPRILRRPNRRRKIPGLRHLQRFPRLLAHDDIDVVWGCVPDHWHGVVYSQAIQAGKDMYGEKPISRWIDQGIRIRDAVRRHSCVFQTGTQQRSSTHFRHACELALNGYLGPVQTICVGAPGGETYPVESPSAPPAGFDYDMWTGPAPFMPFDAKRCEWLAMYMISHYCAGFITNWGVHHLDIAGWGCPEVFEKPFEIEGTGVMPTEGMTDTWISWQMELRWDSGLRMRYSNSDNPNRLGCRFEGQEGWVHVSREGIWSEPASLLTLQLKPHDTHLHDSPEFADPYTAHTADFFRAVRTRQDPVSPVEAGQAASTLGNVADIALRLGRKLTWDPVHNRFVADDGANTMLDRPLRSPWAMVG